MYSTAVPLTLPSLTSDQREQLLQDGPLVSLYEVFATLPDPRSGHGLRYDLPFLLVCLVAALLCNCNSTVAIGQWCREQQVLLGRLFGPRRFLCPSDSLYRRLLPRLWAEQVECVLADWVRATLVAQPDDPIALDGKTVRGAATATQKAPHLLAFYTHHSQETLLQVRVDEKTNEIPIALALLPAVPLWERVCTADALHTHAIFLHVVRTLGGHALLVVKDNQPTLYADLQTYFADAHACWEQDGTVDYQRGRKEWRRIKVTTALNAYLQDAWPHIAQVAQLTRTVTITKTGQTRHEVVYLITTLPPQLASSKRLLELVRGHWHIENGLHYVRDVSFGEDRSQLRTGQAPQIDRKSVV